MQRISVITVTGNSKKLEKPENYTDSHSLNGIFAKFSSKTPLFKKVFTYHLCMLTILYLKLFLFHLLIGKNDFLLNKINCLLL